MLGGAACAATESCDPWYTPTPTAAAGTLIRLVVERLPRPTKAPTPLWFWWSGPAEPDLADLWQAYLARVSIEHTFRFFKQTLKWTTPKLRSPAAADRWTWLLILAYVHLRLARDAVTDLRLPWQPPLPVERCTPARVGRAFSQVLVQLGSPVCAPQPCGRSPGRSPGRSRTLTRMLTRMPTGQTLATCQTLPGRQIDVVTARTGRSCPT